MLALSFGLNNMETIPPFMHVCLEWACILVINEKRREN
jgi:hypothetical protein